MAFVFCYDSRKIVTPTVDTEFLSDLVSAFRQPVFRLFHFTNHLFETTISTTCSVTMGVLWFIIQMHRTVRTGRCSTPNQWKECYCCSCWRCCWKPWNDVGAACIEFIFHSVLIHDRLNLVEIRSTCARWVLQRPIFSIIAIIALPFSFGEFFSKPVLFSFHFIQCTHS